MKDQQRTTSDMNILIVDDTPDNLRILVGLLSEQGYALCMKPKDLPGKKNNRQLKR